MNYTDISTAYAEKYGIITYTVNGCKMVWYEVHFEPMRNKYKHVLDMRTGKETVKLLYKRMVK